VDSKTSRATTARLEVLLYGLFKFTAPQSIGFGRITAAIAGGIVALYLSDLVFSVPAADRVRVAIWLACRSWWDIIITRYN
jgi:hypothetical protein